MVTVPFHTPHRLPLSIFPLSLHQYLALVLLVFFRPIFFVSLSSLTAFLDFSSFIIDSLLLRFMCLHLYILSFFLLSISLSLLPSHTSPPPTLQSSSLHFVHMLHLLFLQLHFLFRFILLSHSILFTLLSLSLPSVYFLSSIFFHFLIFAFHSQFSFSSISLVCVSSSVIFLVLGVCFPSPPCYTSVSRFFCKGRGWWGAM